MFYVARHAGRPLHWSSLVLKAASVVTRSQTGNNRPGCSGPSFWFETTALEMPAGFDRIHHRAKLARDSWPGPHLRTSDVTLVFTTDETCSNVRTAAMGAGCCRLTLSLRSETAQRHCQKYRASCARIMRLGAQVGLAANDQESAWKSLNYCRNAVCTIAGHKLSWFK
jgi:hypothetical protein